MLIEKLQEQLAEFDKKAKLNVRLIQRKERLAYVTVNLSNIIQVTISLFLLSLNAVDSVLLNSLRCWEIMWWFCVC